MALPRRGGEVSRGSHQGEHTPYLNSRLCGRRPYRVGEPFEPGCSAFPEEAVFGIDRLGYQLSAFRSGIGESDAERFRAATIELAIVAEPPLVVLGFRFGESEGWDTVPYAWPLSSGRRGRYLPPARVKSGTRALLWVSLVDARNGLIRAQRGVALEPGFTLALNEAIRAQARVPFNGGSYVQAIAKLHADRPGPDELIEQAVCRTTSLN